MRDVVVEVSLLVLFVLLFVGALVWMVVGMERRHREDMASCQATGRAAWECRALLRGGGTAVVPLVIPR